MSGSFAIASFPIASVASIVVTGGDVVVPVTVGQSSCLGGTTAGDVIRRALQAVLVTGADSPLTADEYQDGLDALNDYMAQLEDSGVRLGYTRCCHVSDRVTVPDGAIAGIIANLAITVAADYGGRVSQALVKRAADGERTLYRLGVQVGSSLLPSSLPMGSANIGQVYQFPTPYAAMSMSGNRIATELTTLSQVELVQGRWHVADFHGLRPDVGGRITNTGQGLTVTVYAEFNLKASGSTSGGVIAIVKNQEVAIYAEGIALSTSPVSALLDGTIAMEAGDYLQVYVGDSASTRDITVIDSLVRLT